jgi:hypothetical protein
MSAQEHLSTSAHYETYFNLQHNSCPGSGTLMFHTAAIAHKAAFDATASLLNPTQTWQHA